MQSRTSRNMEKQRVGVLLVTSLPSSYSIPPSLSLLSWLISSSLHPCTPSRLVGWYKSNTYALQDLMSRNSKSLDCNCRGCLWGELTGHDSTHLILCFLSLDFIVQQWNEAESEIQSFLLWFIFAETLDSASCSSLTPLCQSLPALPSPHCVNNFLPYPIPLCQSLEWLL